MTNHLTSVYADHDPSHPCFASCECGLLVRCANRDAALEAGREHLEAVLTDREHVLAASIRRDLLALTDAMELVVTLRRALDNARNELDQLGKAGAA